MLGSVTGVGESFLTDLEELAQEWLLSSVTPEDYHDEVENDNPIVLTCCES